MKLYHGSNVIVQKPKIVTNGFYKDFGYGFYCTNIEKQAKRWAITKRNHHIVNVYSYCKDGKLKLKQYEEMSDEWLHFVVGCRRGAEHDFDIVEGPMADDTIWDYVEDFMKGTISREAFWVLVKYKYPTYQIVFCTEAALDTLTFERSYSL